MTQNKKPFIIGLTGNSGSGKGAVGKILEKHGALVIDCDKVAHENMAKGGIAYDEIVSAFGREILDKNGEIDRKILGGIVFNDKDKLDLLNSIAHSRIKQRVDEIIKDNGQYNLIVIDAPLLYEARMMNMCNRTWLVTADEDIRLKRVMQRDGITEEKARERFRNQRDFFYIHDLFYPIIQNNYDNEAELEAEVVKYIDELMPKIKP